MLVVTRRERETIRIGRNITITITKIKGNSVRVAIDAPREIDIARGELEANGEKREGVSSGQNRRD